METIQSLKKRKTLYCFHLSFTKGEGRVAIIINIDGRESDFVRKVAEFGSVTSMATLVTMSLAVEEDELNVVTPQVQGFRHEEREWAHLEDEKSFVGWFPPTRMKHLIMNQVRGVQSDSLS